MGKRKEIDLTGSKLHKGLRAAAVNMTYDKTKHRERVDAFDRDFGRCTHNAPFGQCDEC